VDNISYAHSYASSNQLNGTIPSSLGSMTSLRALCVPVMCHVLARPISESLIPMLNRPYAPRCLDHNQLSGSIPSSLSGLNLSNQLCVHTLLCFKHELSLLMLTIARPMQSFGG